jgi:hypothetical protein
LSASAPNQSAPNLLDCHSTQLLSSESGQFWQDELRSKADEREEVLRGLLLVGCFRGRVTLVFHRGGELCQFRGR